VRIAEARARVALREKVITDDAEHSIAIMRSSLEEAGIDVSSHKIDIDIIMTGKPKSLQDKLRVVLNALIQMEGETGTVKRSDLTDRLASEFDIDRLESERLLSLMKREGTVYEPREGYLKKA
jgi:replicative DNA helicase Mcm